MRKFRYWLCTHPTQPDVYIINVSEYPVTQQNNCTVKIAEVWGSIARDMFGDAVVNRLSNYSSIKNIEISHLIQYTDEPEKDGL